MARIINTAPLSDVAGMPFSSGSLDQIQESYFETNNELLKAMIGKEYDPTKSYRIEGAQMTNTSGTNYTVASGSIFYNGEIYLVDSLGITSFSSGIGLTVSITQNTINADPVTLTDTSVVNIHNIRKLKYVNSASSWVPLPYDYLTDAHITRGTILQEDGIKDIVQNMNGATFSFFKSYSINHASTSAANTISLDPTNAVQGCCVRIQETGTPGSTVTYNPLFGSVVLVCGDGIFDTNGNYSADIYYQGSAANWDFLVQEITGTYLSAATNITMNSTNWGVVGAAPFVKKDSVGRAYLSGQFIANSGVHAATDSTFGEAVIGTIPVGFRPARDINFPVHLGESSGSDYIVSVFIVAATGYIKYGPLISGVVNPIHSFSVLDIENISYLL